MSNNKISIQILEKVEQRSDYKYIIQKGWYAYCAYHTEKGFNDFLERCNIDLSKYTPRVNETEENGKIETYYLDVQVEEVSFWKLEDIPVGAIKFTGLSNGSYVDCYYIHTENGAKIFRPNPNAKEVYKPMSIEEHIEFSRING